jgi:hypothetical protein
MKPLPKNPRPDAEIPFMHIVVPRDEIERCEIEATLNALQVLMDGTETARRFKNNVTISFQGYDQDHRGLFEIAEVREFVEELNANWYAWLFFMTKDIRISPLAAIALCLCRYTRSSNGLFIPVKKDSKRFFWDQFGALRGHCKAYGLSNEQTEAAVYEVIDYLMKIGFASGCDAPQFAIDSGKTRAVLRYM